MIVCFTPLILVALMALSFVLAVIV